MYIPIVRIPNANTRIQTSCCYSIAVKSDGINLREVSAEGAQTSAFRNAPYFGCGIITSRNHKVALDLQTSNASLVTNKYILADSLLDIPNAESGISRARDRCVRVGHLQTTDGRGMASEGVNRFAAAHVNTSHGRKQSELPSSHIPDTDVSVTTSTDKDIIPRNHSPHAHNMSL